MTTLLRFIAPSAWSIGELANAIELAARLPEHVRADFLVSSKHLYYAQAAGVDARVLPRGRAAAHAVREAVTDAGVSGVVLADHHLLGLERTGFTIADACVGAPLVALDSLAFGPGPTHVALAVSQGSADPMLAKFFPPIAEIGKLPDEVQVLRPVPVAGTSVTAAGREVTPFDLYGVDGPLRGKIVDRDAVRSRLGVLPEQTLVVVAISNWASMAMTKPGLGCPNPQRDIYLRLRVAWLQELLRRLDRPIALFGVSTESFGESSADVQTMATGFFAITEFTELLSVADLYLSENLTSGAMARAVLLGVPAITFTREGSAPEGDAFVQEWCTHMRERFPQNNFNFLVNPFGWIDELKPLLASNPYLSSIQRVHIEDLDAQVHACNEILATHTRPARDALNRQRAILPPGNEALLAAFGLT